LKLVDETRRRETQAGEYADSPCSILHAIVQCLIERTDYPAGWDWEAPAAGMIDGVTDEEAGCIGDE
jgi:hypothetical protein